MNITRIATQGRPHSSDFVEEFGVSYGYNGLDYADYKDAGGNVKVNDNKFKKPNLTLLNLSN